MLWRVICMKAGALREMRSWKRSGDSCLVVRFEFGRAVAEETLQDWYKPITRKQDDYPRNLRVKINKQGLYRTRYWSADKQPLDVLDTHAGLYFNARVVFRGVWIGEDAFGLVADCTDLQLVEESAPLCPF